MSDYHVFSGKIYKVGIIRYVDVPADVSRAMGDRAHVAVRGEVEGVPLRTTLVSRGRGCYRVALHSDIRKKLKVDAGTYVEIALERDEESREPALPPALVLALRQSPKAQAQFRSMTTALRRQIVRYLTSVKQQATLERRVTKFVRRLEQMCQEKAKKKK
ncbi:MAG TPA: YdeI/OmpD-associated family protein [Dongiaceae bacterium]|nr:YdeI/OmpD-associated family protein [Dongiaceae bacterium]